MPRSLAHFPAQRRPGKVLTVHVMYLIVYEDLRSRLEVW
jgi:hypothetical protein